MCSLLWNASAVILAKSYFGAVNISSNAIVTTNLFPTSTEAIAASAGKILSNTSCLEHAPTFSNSAVLRVGVLLAMAMASLIGNLATLWNIQQSCAARRSNRHSWSAIYFLIIHLSIADLLVTFFCIFGEAAWSYTIEWLAGSAACKLFKFTQMFSLYLSTFVLVLIGVDRWIAVKYPWKSLHMAKRCYRLITIAYVLSFVLSIPQVIRSISCKVTIISI